MTAAQKTRKRIYRRIAIGDRHESIIGHHALLLCEDLLGTVRTEGAHSWYELIREHMRNLAKKIRKVT